MKDALNRRSRFSSRQPVDRVIELNETDDALFAALKRHGKLPAPYLYRFTNKKSYPRFQDRLTQLYNGSTDGMYYLDRPEEQENNKNARYQPIVYCLPDQTGQGWFVHQLMDGCIGASTELQLPEDIRYVDQEETLGTRPLKINLGNGRSVVPDRLFKFEYRDGNRAFARETDRATEDEDTIKQKIENYNDIFRQRLYQEWGVKGLMVLFATTTENRKQRLLQLFGNEPRFLVGVFPDFSKRWRVPTDLLPNVFQWESVRGMFDIRG